MIRTLNGTRVRTTQQLREPPVADREFVELDADSGTRVFIHRRVLRDALSLTRINVPHETGAILMGATFTDGRCPFSIVTDLIMPLPGEVIGTSATVTITATGRRRMESEGRLRDPIASGVGWMHSHPVQTAFFSATDRSEQSKWRAPASVGLVVSGREDARPRFRVFLGPEAEEAFLAGSPRTPRAPRRTEPPIRKLPRVTDAPEPDHGEALDARRLRAARSEQVRRERRRRILMAVWSAGLVMAVAIALVLAVLDMRAASDTPGHRTPAADPGSRAPAVTAPTRGAP